MVFYLYNKDWDAVYASDYDNIKPPIKYKTLFIAVKNLTVINYFKGLGEAEETQWYFLCVLHIFEHENAIMEKWNPTLISVKIG